MKKIILLVGILLVVLGGGIFFAAFAAAGFDFEKMGNVSYETKTFEVTEDFSDIDIKDNVADVEFILSDDNKTRVECYQAETEKHDVKVEGGKLIITCKSKTRIFSMRFSFKNQTVKVYLPESSYNNLTIKNDTGDVTIPAGFTFAEANIETDTGDILFNGKVNGEFAIKSDTGNISTAGSSASKLTINVDTGDVKVTELGVETKLSVETQTGNVTLKKVTGADVNIKTDTGDVNLDEAKAAQMDIATDTGDVSGTVKDDMIFYTETDTGDVSVPKSTNGGICNVTTETGDINLKIAN